MSKVYNFTKDFVKNSLQVVDTYFWIITQWQGRVSIKNFETIIIRKLRQISIPEDHPFGVYLFPQDGVLAWRFRCHPNMLLLNTIAFQMSVMRLVTKCMVQGADELLEDGYQFRLCDICFKVFFFMNTEDEDEWDEYYLEGYLSLNEEKRNHKEINK
jgi:hypothetical protein